DVVYEFTEEGGMQMVIAHYAPSSAAEVFHQIVQSLGQPTSGAVPDDADLAHVEASWTLPGGGAVTFSGRNRRLTIMGPRGDTLRPDIRLRETNPTSDEQ